LQLAALLRTALIFTCSFDTARSIKESIKMISAIVVLLLTLGTWMIADARGASDAMQREKEAAAI
jgi:hypothetical protein